MFLLVVAALVGVLAVVLAYLYGTRNHRYWSKRGVKHDAPLPFLGTARRQFLQQLSWADCFAELYWKHPADRFAGYYMGNTPVLVLRDPELINRVMVQDFAHFYSRAIHPLDPEPELLLNNMFSVDGDLWKLLRTRMSPAFTSAKLKAMFPLIVESAEKLHRVATAKGEVDARDLMARFTTDFIGVCGFGVDAAALDDENSVIRKLGKRIVNNTLRDGAVALLKLTVPSITRRLTFFSPYIEDTMTSLVRSIMEERRYEPSGRNDFIDQLLELRAQGRMVGESIERRRADGAPETVARDFDEAMMIAQVFVFFGAGFETSSSSTSYLLHELAFHPEIQEKCQREIDTVLARHGGRLCYDAVNEMTYLEQCFKEAMRIFPSLGFLLRTCDQPWTIPGTDVTIDKGVKVVIPVKALQNDPRFFPEPGQFRPERFHPDNLSDVTKHVYLPFGAGPRGCVGERLGRMQSLAGVAALLSRCSVAPSARSRRPVQLDPAGNVVQIVRGGLPLTITPRQL